MGDARAIDSACDLSVRRAVFIGVERGVCAFRTWSISNVLTTDPVRKSKERLGWVGMQAKSSAASVPTTTNKHSTTQLTLSQCETSRGEPFAGIPTHPRRGGITGTNL